MLKIERRLLRWGLRSPLGFYLINHIIKKYARRFYVKVEQVSINHDHLHLLVRFSKRSLGQHFLRVVTGQIAQQFKNNGFLAAKNVTGTPTKTPKLWVGLNITHSDFEVFLCRSGKYYGLRKLQSNLPCSRTTDLLAFVAVFLGYVSCSGNQYRKACFRQRSEDRYGNKRVFPF